jgi:NAD(P)-dependent dehydrogenase (short-subunit alcohol dehydrogenase family)
MKHLEGKVAWVTGAGSGIGEATALLLAEEGATVVLSGRRADRLDGVARRIAEAGGTAYAQPGDLGKSATSAATGEFIRDKLDGRLDILVNNAGHNIPDRFWAVLAPARIDEMIDANLKAPFYCVTVALPFMRARKSGVLIHTSSIDGLQVSKFSGPAYAASKHGVVAMSHSINLEESRNGIRRAAHPAAAALRGRRPHPLRRPPAADRPDRPGDDHAGIGALGQILRCSAADISGFESKSWGAARPRKSDLGV